MAELGAGLVELGVRRPQRADAARNFDALLAAAREVFAEQGADASLEDVARRAGVGIGTLYRNFPTRRDLVERLYIGEVADLCATAREVADLPPWEALAGWLDRFVGYIATKQAIKEALSAGSPVFAACRAEMYGAGTPLFDRAQAAGEVRADLCFDDLVKLLAGITSVSFADDAQRDRVVAVALDGVRTSR
ncbi:TetR/AcrR family transcriptional regulator [Modestobacter sp. L9-4]|uniref:TetR/AcrR family transcriptional regulator n=1 Tax=Modestobacter sp. L9-4 TaxID=2851567 RepID=UPI001C76F70F|nr:TetR/AcrR family transcriptional regulator [Modestobacter sp. L9-4]QXG76767.1 TetR/AcrR family transcriptional regulator [Modestobacter sp. L9-4]